MAKKSKHKNSPKKQQVQQPKAMKMTESIVAPTLPESGVSHNPLASMKPSVTAIPEQYVRRDIARVGIMLASIALVLIALVIINGHTDKLGAAGRTLAIFAGLRS
jgi:hypothetical protein